MMIPPIIGFVYPGASDWISLLGAVCITTLLITIPTLMAVHNWRKEGGNKVKICITLIWGACFTVLGYIAGAFVILKMVGVTN